MGAGGGGGEFTDKGEMDLLLRTKALFVNGGIVLSRVN